MNYICKDGMILISWVLTKKEQSFFSSSQILWKLSFYLNIKFLISLFQQIVFKLLPLILMGIKSFLPGHLNLIINWLTSHLLMLFLALFSAKLTNHTFWLLLVIFSTWTVRTIHYKKLMCQVLMTTNKSKMCIVVVCIQCWK